MGGLLATNLVEISKDPSCLVDGGFWAVSSTFEGEFVAAKFATVDKKEFPGQPWQQLQSTWTSSLSKNEYVNYVERIRESISDGWVYQVNACNTL